jgi:hypothetical protein
MPDAGLYSKPEIEDLWGDVVEKAMKQANQKTLEADKSDFSEVIRIRYQDGKYYLAGKEIDINHLEEWGERIVAEMAKRMLRK